MKTIAFAALTLATLIAAPAVAQDAPTGPAIPGICVYSHDRLLAQSTAGQSVIAGLQRIEGEINAELQPFQQFIQSEGTALQQGRGTIPQEQLQQRAQALEARFQEAQQLAQTRQQELRYTEMVQRRAIATAADPIVLALYGERQCGLLLAREGTVMRSNPSMDITDEVIRRLNATLPSLSFSRMAVPVEAAQ